MSDLIEVENRTAHEQNVFMDDGTMHTLLPHEVRFVLPDLAKTFLKRRAGFVHIYEAVSIPKIDGEETRWIANVTGNPFLPATITKMTQDPKTGRVTKEEYPNPLREPMIIREEMHVSQKVEKSASSGFTFNMPPIMVKLPPFKRYPVPDSVSHWLIGRDAMNEEDCRGRLLSVRAPTSFEPNVTWPLNEIVCFASMVDKHGIFGTKDRAGVIALQVESNFNKDQSHKLSLYRAELIRVLFFRLINQSFELPHEEAFRSEYARFKQALEKR